VHWQGTNGWRGETRIQSRTTDWDAYGPQGQHSHLRIDSGSDDVVIFADITWQIGQ
jgi:hypothetical protein